MSSHQARLSDFWTVRKSDATAADQAPTSSKPPSTRAGPRPPGGGTLLCPPLHFSVTTNHVYQALGGHHQVNEGGNRHQTNYWAARQAKLDEQIKEHRDRVDSAAATASDVADRGGSCTGRARSKIFAGLVFSIDGYTGPDVGDLKLRRLIVEHGGHLRVHFAVSRTTHVVATSLAGSKMHQALTTRRTSSRSTVNRACVFVMPTWVLDSIAAGRRLPEADYLVVRDLTLGRATAARRPAARTDDGVVDKVAASPSHRSATLVQMDEVPSERIGREEMRLPTPPRPPRAAATSEQADFHVDAHESALPIPREVAPVSFFQLLSHSSSPGSGAGSGRLLAAVVAPKPKRSFFRDVVSGVNIE
ncbi:hypothetical protein AMAG_01798 [Allomyces macrogynus ATCC 38327]|uniref:BRCT domain-containing protein n=1 Tax=Allomyces macrogynus (strain ATCC 38327) TaxID=578462 RepID=A0A0L0S0P5_ALLM3|nr:hypothetical protein AMAG_01798 [Allomyces macrogynus ATCC 38327]|eukprot:KNE55946.1 hypothetical protein AMAG_01798 [Allomyces macrogynus ATCC 38327]